MPTTAYCTADQIRKQNARITVDLISDEDLVSLAHTEVDEAIIDVLLTEIGTPFATPSPLVSLISAMLTAAMFHDARLSHSNDESRWSAAKRKWAMDRLEEIQVGKIKLKSAGTPALIVASDPTADRPSTDVFVGPPERWQEKPEYREDED